MQEKVAKEKAELAEIMRKEKMAQQLRNERREEESNKIFFLILGFFARF